MKKFILIYVFLAFAAGNAEADESWYSALGIGAVFHADADIDDPTGVLAALATNVQYDLGFGLSGAYGYRWNDFRLEGEVAYVVNDVDNLEIIGVGISGTGDTDTLSFMVNGWRDFSLAAPWSINVGGGLGIAVVSFNDVTVGGLALADDTDTVFAYQFGVGMGYDIADDTVVSVDYRLFSTLDPEFTSAGGVPFSSEDFLHKVIVGIRWDF